MIAACYDAMVMKGDSDNLDAAIPVWTIGY